MTKSEAIHGFFCSFGLPAYAGSVPADVQFPYLLYTPVLDSLSGGEVSLPLSLYFYSESEAPANAKAEELSAAIGAGGAVLRCEGGAIWLRRGSPWCQSVPYALSPYIKRRDLNLLAEFWTRD